MSKYLIFGDRYDTFIAYEDEKVDGRKSVRVHAGTPYAGAR